MGMGVKIFFRLRTRERKRAKRAQCEWVQNRGSTRTPSQGSPQKNFENKVFKDNRKIDLQHTKKRWKTAQFVTLGS